MIKRTCLFVTILIFLVTMGFALGHAKKSPSEFFGLKIGSDKTLVKYPEIIKYFKYIDSQSERILMKEEGKSTLGNSMYAVFISSESNLKQLDQLVAVNKKLANPDTITGTEARQLKEKARVFILVTCTIHATEIASSQFAMQYAHKLATTSDPDYKKFMEEVVLILMPSINPDGNIMVTDWYNKTLGTPHEGSMMPWLYHHYAGHDNNRDFYMLNLEESRVVNAILHHRYYPHIFLDMHQMGSTGPRMFVPPFKDPLNSNLNPIMLRETDIIGGFMAWKLQEHGKKGVASSYAFDAYWPGGSKNTAWFKNVVGILTELASTRMASPIYIEPNELRVRSKGLAEYKAQVNFPDPWQGGWWRLQDIIDYEHIAVDALLEVTAKNRFSFINNFYKMGAVNVKGEKYGTLSAYIVPAQQWDTPASYTFLQKMKEGGVRIFRLDEEARIHNKILAKGDFVIPLAQPYGDFVKTMMEIQYYPEIKYMRNGPVIEPYDASGWTMQKQMGVNATAINAPIDHLKLSPLNDASYPETTVKGSGDYYVMPGRFNRSVIAVNRLYKQGTPVYRAVSSNKKLRAGDFLVRVSQLPQAKFDAAFKGTGVSVFKVGVVDAKQLKKQNAPRIGIYQSYRPSMDEGWTRWVLDHFEFSYKVLHNKEFQAKKFGKDLDVIIFPDLGRDVIIKGLATGYYARYAGNMPPEYKGGMGSKGFTALKNWVKQGGSIVLLDSASQLASKDFKLPLTNVLQKTKSEDFYCPGSLLSISVDNQDPLGWGMERDNFIYFSRSPAFRTRIPTVPYVSRKVVSQFSATGSHLLSGYLKGGQLLDRAVMTVRYTWHKGNVMVLGGRVQHRAQTFGTFKFLFNAINYASLK